ncbi:MAG: nucleoside-diphosphate kinase [archaeon]
MKKALIVIKPELSKKGLMNKAIETIKSKGLVILCQKNETFSRYAPKGAEKFHGFEKRYLTGGESILLATSADDAVKLAKQVSSEIQNILGVSDNEMQYFLHVPDNNEVAKYEIMRFFTEKELKDKTN